MRPRGRRSFEPPRRPEPQTRINDAIRVPRVRLIGENGEQLGIKGTDEAREYAYGKNLDLVEVDDSSETLGKRIRNAEVEKIPFVVVYGDKESDDSLAIRERGGEQTTLSLAEFQGKLATLSPWQVGAEPSLTS